MGELPLKGIWTFGRVTCVETGQDLNPCTPSPSLPVLTTDLPFEGAAKKVL